MDHAIAPRQALITGGAGFIGSHVAEMLLQRGCAVRVLDNLSTGDRSNLSTILGDVDFRQCDLRDLDDVSEAAKGCDLVVHLAALGSVPRSFADPLTTHEVNATGTLNVLLASRDAAVERLIFASSSSVFGSNQVLPKVEHLQGEPLSPYAATKRIGEDYCRQFAERFDMDAVAVRFFNVFGPRQTADHVYAAVIPKFIHAALVGEPVTIHGDGKQSRDFTYISNVVDGLILIAQSPRSKTKGEVFHLACGRSVSLLEVLAEIDTQLGIQVQRVHTSRRPGDIRDSLADITKITEAVGYVPAVDVPQGIAHTLSWFKGLT